MTSISTLLLLGAAATAAPPDPGDCQVQPGDAISPGLPAIHVTCSWPDVPAHTLEHLLGRVDDHAPLFWMITDDHLVREEDGRSLVFQRHQAPVTRPREALVWIQKQRQQDGAWTLTWALDDGAFQPSDGALRPARNDGRWEVRPTPDGGSQLRLDLAYDPGGAVPSWLVRWCQGPGAMRALDGLHDRAAREARLVAGSP